MSLCIFFGYMEDRRQLSGVGSSTLLKQSLSCLCCCTVDSRLSAPWTSGYFSSDSHLSLKLSGYLIPSTSIRPSVCDEGLTPDYTRFVQWALLWTKPSPWSWLDFWFLLWFGLMFEIELALTCFPGFPWNGRSPPSWDYRCPALNSFLSRFYFMGVCLYVYICNTCMPGCPQRPEENIRSPRL